MSDINNDMILALDTSVKNISLAIIKDQQILASSNQIPQVSQSSELLSVIEFTFKQAQTELKQISKILFCHGPGSFTSLRIGMATIKGLIWGSDVSVYFTSSLLFRNLSVKNTLESAEVISLIRMGRDRLAAGFFTSGEGDAITAAQFNERISSPQAIFEHLIGHKKSVILTGDGVVSLDAQALQALGSRVTIINSDVTDPLAFLTILQNNLYQQTAVQSMSVNYMMAPDIG